MSARQILFILLLAALLIGRQIVLREAPAPSRAEPVADRGYYVLGATLRGLAEDGAAEIEITVERAEQQPALARVALERVDVTYLDRKEMPWRMRADAGHISDDWQLLELRGDVRLEGIGDGGEAVALLTENLTVMVPARRALTQSQVRLEGPRGVLTARGMTADLAAQQIELEADVHGRFSSSTGIR